MLPEEDWENRHRGVIVLLVLHAIAIPIYGVIQGYNQGHVFLESLIIPATLFGAIPTTITRATRTLAVSIGLLTSSAILVHFSNGLIEMHFHFFVMVAVVALYQAWAPFLLAIGYVLLHHGVMGVVSPESVFNHPAAINSPWLWAGVHSLFIAGTSIACLVTWRLQEDALDERRGAEGRWRRESAVVAQLNDIGLTLNAEFDTHEVMQRVTDMSTGLTEAAFGAFFHNVDDGARGSYMLYTLSGAPPEAFENFPMPRATQIFAPTFKGEAPVRLDDVRADARYGQSAPYFGMPPGHLEVRSYLAVPVTSPRGTVLGGLFFGHPEVGRFSEEHEKLAVGVASHAAVALDNARLHEAEKRSLSRMSVIADAGRRFARSLDHDALVTALTEILVPEVGDLCVVYLAQPGEEPHAVSMRGGPHVPEGLNDPANMPAAIASTGPVADVIRTRTSHLVTEFVDDGTPSDLASGGSGTTLTYLQELLAPARITTTLTFPLEDRTGVFGAVSLITVDASGRHLADEDRSLVEELGRRAAAAFENARLYATQRAAALTLQHSLLPERLPSVSGVETSARYIPGGDGVEIGGDWYDVIALPDGGLGLVMGDVVGRGVEAAALMGQLRNGLRALALDGHGPGEILSKLNRLLLELGPTDGLATLVYGAFDPESGTLRMANAGHPPPLVLGIGAEPSFLDDGRGVPLGASVRATYPEAITTIAPGATIIFYTDGLVEDRRTSLDEGLARLVEASAGDADVDGLCDTILDGCLEGRSVRDDIALLVMRPSQLGPDLRLRLPSRPDVLRPLRATLRRWLHAAGAGEDEAQDVLVCVGEACSNAIQHAGAAGKQFELEAHIDDHEVRVSVRDQGSWRPPRKTDWGRGLSIMEQVMDDVQVERTDNGTLVSMRRGRVVSAPDRAVDVDGEMDRRRGGAPTA